MGYTAAKYSELTRQGPTYLTDSILTMIWLKFRLEVDCLICWVEKMRDVCGNVKAGNVDGGGSLSTASAPRIGP